MPAIGIIFIPAKINIDKNQILVETQGNFNDNPDR